MSDGLEATGRAIWLAYKADNLSAGAQALVRELARCADTLDRLDGLASGRRESWAELVYDHMGEIVLTVDKILTERRNHQMTFKSLHNELRLAGIKPEQAEMPVVLKDEPRDVLAERRAAKERRERQHG